MNDLMLFEGHEILILMKDDVNFDFKGDFLIRAKDVATVLEYKGTSATQEVLKFVKRNQVYLVKNSDMAICHIRKLNNAGETFITNLALNRVFGKSGQPKAEPFQDWLYEDMLPSVQKHGAYLTPEKVEEVLLNPDTIIRLATQVKREREEKEKALETLETQRPKVVFAEAIEVSEDAILVKELAGILKQKGVKIGQNRLFQWLRDRGYLCKKRGEMYNLPTQKSLEMGLFEIKKGVRTGSNGEMKQTRTTKITGKGQVHFVNKILEEEGMFVH